MDLVALSPYGGQLEVQLVAVNEESLHSDTWYAVAELQLCLSPKAEIHKQVYRDQLWYLIEEPYNQKFFRVTPQAYHFLVQLDVRWRLDEVWERYALEHPEDTPSQDEVIRLLSQLNTSNLLHTKGEQRSSDVFERQKKAKRKELKGKLASFLFVRIPLLNPQPYLDKIQGFTRLFISWPVFVLWLASVLWALKNAVDHRQAFMDQSQGILSASNMVLLYLTLIVLKIAHELGHALITCRFGGTVPRMGIMLLLLTPIPYLDVSSSWRFCHRRHRILVGAGGMLAELWVAALATYVWVNTGEGILKAVSFNAMVIGSVSSLIFNGNPLVKFDVYYMLSDVLGIPNLFQRAREQWIYLFEKYLFKVKDLSPPSVDLREAWWLGVYGVLSFLYRLFISISIMMFVADQWMLLGAVLLATFLWMWGVKPLWSIAQYLCSSPNLKFKRSRAVAITSSILLIIVLVCFQIPFHRSVKLRGVLLAREVQTLHAPVAGVLLEMPREHGSWVKQGDLLFRFSDRDLRLDHQQALAQLQEVEFQIAKSRSERALDLKALSGKQKLLEEKLALLADKLERCQLKAPCDGLFFSEKWKSLLGSWQEDRATLGKVIPRDAYDFSTVAEQEKARPLFDVEFKNAEVMLHGRAGEVLKVEEVQVIPYEEDTLPSAILGWRAGGDIAVKDDDPLGLQTVEPFFKIVAKLPDGEYHQSRSGWLRLELAPESLAERLQRSLRQVLQKRYRF